MKHFIALLFLLATGNFSQKEMRNSVTTNSFEQNYDITEINNLDTDQIFITVKFYTGTSQQDIDDAINTINPVNFFSCPNNPNNFVMRVERLSDGTQGTGRGNNSGSNNSGGGNGETDDFDPVIDSIIESITAIHSYRYGIFCD